MKFTTPNGFTYDSAHVEQLSRFLDSEIGLPVAVIPFTWDAKETVTCS